MVIEFWILLKEKCVMMVILIMMMDVVIHVR